MIDGAECVDCGMQAPQTNTEDTLLSSAHGWRLTRATGPDGKPTLEWRCPACWEKYKARKIAVPPPPSSGTRARVELEPPSSKSRKV
jgi:hypothetical protein